jgi:hypothetical protein
LTGGEVRKETAFLDDVADAAADGSDCVRLDGPAIEEDGAGVGDDQADDQAEKRRFAAATGAKEDVGLASFKSESDIDEARVIAKTLRYVLKFDHGELPANHANWRE